MGDGKVELRQVWVTGTKRRGELEPKENLGLTSLGLSSSVVVASFGSSLEVVAVAVAVAVMVWLLWLLVGLILMGGRTSCGPLIGGRVVVLGRRGGPRRAGLLELGPRRSGRGRPAIMGRDGGRDLATMHRTRAGRESYG